MSDEIEVQNEHIPRKGKPKAKSSIMWTKFTIVNDKRNIAACNICGAKLSFRATVTNLKKHLIRKHNYDITQGKSTSYMGPYKYEKIIRPSFGSRETKTLSDLAGLDGLILNVMADGEDNVVEMTGEDGETVKEQVVYTTDADNIHDYCGNEEGQEEEEVEVAQHSGTQEKRKWPKADQATPCITKYGSTLFGSKFEENKRSRIMSLQLECLEIRKYTMQMEALLLEQQLNLPRSMFTEHLKSTHTNTRGTQTDLAGSNTKVFYVLENATGGGPLREAGQHLFTFQARAAEEVE